MTPLRKQMYQIPEPTQADYPGAKLPDKYPSSFMKTKDVLKKAGKKDPKGFKKAYKDATGPGAMGHEVEDKA